MGINPSRRTITKGAAWSIPAVTLAASAPAMAVSCDPAANLITQDANLTFNATGAMDSHDLAVTYTNSGTDVIVAGTVLTFRATGSYDPDRGAPSIAPVVMPSSVEVSTSAEESDHHDEGQTESGMTETVTLTLTQDLAAGAMISVALHPSDSFGYAKIVNADGTPGASGPNPYGGGESGIWSTVTDATSQNQSIVDTPGCRTVAETVTVTSP